MNANTDSVTFTSGRTIKNVDVDDVDAYLAETKTAPAADPAPETIE